MPAQRDPGTYTAPKPKKVKRAHRTPAEISALAPQTPTGEQLKAAALKARARGKKAQAAALLAAAATGLPAGPSVSEANKKTKKAVRKLRRAQTVDTLREAARESGVPTRTELGPTPAFILKEQSKDARQLSKKLKADRARAEQERWDDSSLAEQLVEGGVVGQIDRKASNKGRQFIYGSKNPSTEEAIMAAVPLPAAKGAQLARLLLRGSKGLNTARRVAKTEEAAQAARVIRKADTAAAKAAARTKLGKVGATGKGMGKGAKDRLSKVERQARRAKRQDRAVKAVTSPVLAAAGTAPGSIGTQVRENLEATFVPGKAANPVKTAQTTLKALPALFTAGGSVAGAAIKSAKTGDPGYIGGTLKAIGEGTGELLEPLVKGDSEEIARAMEEDIGYPFAPLLPRGAISKPGKAAGKIIVKPVTVPYKAVKKVRRAREIKKGNIPTEPGRVRKLKQRTGGGKVRRDVAVTVTRPRERGVRTGVREAREITGQKLGRTSGREEMVSAAAVLGRYGIGRRNTLKELDNAIRGVRDEGDVVNDREVAAWLHENPEVLADEGFWGTVDQWRSKQDPKVTSKRAQFMAQADVAGVATPKSPRMLRSEADRFASKAADATGRDAEIYLRAARRRRAHAKRIEAKWKEKGVSREQAAERFDPDEVERMIEQTRAKRSPDLEDPIWLSEPAPKVDPESSRASKFGLKQHASTGATRRAGKADRSLPALLEKSVIIPHVRRGIARGVRQTIEKYRLVREIAGKKRHAFTGDEILELHKKGEIDLRDVVAVPSRDWKAAMESEMFDLNEFYGSEVAPALRGDLEYLRQTKAKGTKYVLLPREVGRELDYQLNPKEGAPLQKAMQGTAGIASRVVLFSPAWAAAQVINESSQLLADAGIRGTVGGVADLIKVWKTDRELYRSILDKTGAGSPVAQPFGRKTAMSKGDYISTSKTIRGMRRYPPTRAVMEFFNTFSNFDRWKTTRLRAVSLFAKNNKEFGQFTRGLGGSLRSMDEISSELGKMSRQERHKFINSPEGTRILDRHLDHVDDMMGNWEAFTRYERSFGPLVAFLPYLRMSLRWTFRTYPEKHPVKAQILYLLAQQNREQLERLTGAEPSVLEGAFPVLYDQQGEVEGVLPGGARFGAPAGNVIVEVIGEANLAGLSRLLNPALSTAATSFYGVSPFTGKQEVTPGTVEWGWNGLEALLSLPPPFRAFGLNTIREKSAAAQAFEEIDPERAIRSAANPFIGMSAESFRDQTILSNALEAASNKPDYGDLVDAIMAKDKDRVKELAERVDLAAKAQKILDKYLPSLPGEDRALSKAGAVVREGSKGLRSGSSSPFKTSSASSSPFKASTGAGSPFK